MAPVPAVVTATALAAALATTLAALMVAAELAHVLAFRSLRRAPVRRDCDEAVILLLGHPALFGRLHPVQKWRCRMALRSIDPRRFTTIVVSGGSERGPSEAAIMAAHLRRARHPVSFRIVEEHAARSTHDNIALCLPMLSSRAAIQIVSDPLHCRRAQAILLALAPETAPRITTAAVYRQFEHPLLKIGTTIVELWKMMAPRRDRAHVSERYVGGDSPRPKN